MRRKSPWTPRLAEIAAPPSRRLEAALAEDISAGLLVSGERLPAHRDLAWRLGIGVGTVTEAYAILERRGLTQAVKGRGTFVTAASSSTRTVWDLSTNSPPSLLPKSRLSKALTTIADEIDPRLVSNPVPVGGYQAHRNMMTKWITDLGAPADPTGVLLTNGAFQALSTALLVACGKGGTVLTDPITYPGLKALSRSFGYNTHGIAQDLEGMVPAALDEVLQRYGGLSACVYLVPTMQNPTTRTMGLQRRAAIAEVCRRHSVLLIEDDAYSLGLDPARPPIASLAPERTIYVNSLSKTIGSGLQLGLLAVPPHLLEETVDVLSGSGSRANALTCLLLEQWLADGTAIAIRDAVRVEARNRQDLAQSILGCAMQRPSADGFHVWLPMPAPAARHVYTAALGQHIILSRHEAFAVDEESPDAGIRLCLGSLSISELQHPLRAIFEIATDARRLVAA
ncbi:PLP-dependent aminotransferase family protein [Ensifer sp. ENS04]|uniref:aminotransferase-like domain-containing protein n=1 Tax=Ensifer sp. ENS04 TaxID=2769281 RepID=UPI001782EF42|nr:PLP-dependent aminotransferase family protein [Ensifer sp. ENS04]MBD9544746.1 PLP-dependent aminotransferase family protein [Ensifer sp. ENS04]